jgi:hypothetical protein
MRSSAVDNLINRHTFSAFRASHRARRVGGQIVTVVEGAERAGSDATNHMFIGSDNAHYLACRRGQTWHTEQPAPHSRDGDRWQAANHLDLVIWDRLVLGVLRQLRNLQGSTGQMKSARRAGRSQRAQILSHTGRHEATDTVCHPSSHLSTKRSKVLVGMAGFEPAASCVPNRVQPVARRSSMSPSVPFTWGNAGWTSPDVAQ